MKKIGKIIFLLIYVLILVYFVSCQNPFLADAINQYKVDFETNGGTSIDSYRTGKIEFSPETTKTGFVFDGWYANSSLEGEPITFPYELKNDTTFYAKWVEKGTVIFDFRNCKTNSDFVNEIVNKYGNCYTNGVLTLNSDKEKIVFKGSDSHTTCFNDLCIKLSRINQKIIFENFSFSSSKSSSLIYSTSDIEIEYRGTNKIFSSSPDAVSLIESLETITIKSNDSNSKLELQPNTVSSSTEGSIGVKANKVIIDGGNFVIQESNGINYSENDTSGISGRNGSSGIKATETIIKNKASVTITGGNGGKGRPCLPSGHRILLPQPCAGRRKGTLHFVENDAVVGKLASVAKSPTDTYRFPRRKALTCKHIGRGISKVHNLGAQNAKRLKRQNGHIRVRF